MPEKYCDTTVLSLPARRRHSQEQQALEAAKLEWGIDGESREDPKASAWVAAHLAQFAEAEALRQAWRAKGGRVLFVEISQVEGLFEYWAVDGLLRCVHVTALSQVVEKCWDYDPGVPIEHCYFNAWALVIRHMQRVAGTPSATVVSLAKRGRRKKR